ncbi:MAG: F0F1 ATP synthase subunit B [Nautiliaceae bacterium]
MKKFLLFLAGVVAFASEGSGHTDIIPRTINFIIFVAILWYLVGDKVKRFFEERREKIAKRFQEVEEKLREVKVRKEALKAELAEAKRLAEEIIENAKREAEYIKDKIHIQTEEEIEIMNKHFAEFKETTMKKARQEAVKEFMEDVLKDVHITSEDAAKLILKA